MEVFGQSAGHVRHVHLGVERRAREARSHAIEAVAEVRSARDLRQVDLLAFVAELALITFEERRVAGRLPSKRDGARRGREHRSHVPAPRRVGDERGVHGALGFL